mmetsp:Transcript_90866/g.111219  ORF Transcript_90866/g.111219 Transcript_90866/m.111219 type:complete len:311 (+) Transcript_90866:46-978(+)
MVFESKGKLILFAKLWMIYELYKLYIKITKKKYSIKNKVILITGGASGIGKLLAIKCKNEGGIVCIWDINDKGLNEMKNIVDLCQKCDVTSYDNVINSANVLLSKFNKLDILVNNAGIVFGNTLLDLTPKQINLTYGVNILSHYWTVKAFLPGMIKRESGHIISIVSTSGLAGVGYLTDYSASKFACNGFDQSLKRELKLLNKHKGIYFTGIFPHFISTGMFDGTKPEAKSLILRMIYPGWLKPERVCNEIYNAIIYKKRKVKIPKYFGDIISLMTFLCDYCGLPHWINDYLVNQCGELSHIKGNKKHKK